jgi:hypothetical protein
MVPQSGTDGVVDDQSQAAHDGAFQSRHRRHRKNMEGDQIEAPIGRTCLQGMSHRKSGDGLLIGRQLGGIFHHMDYYGDTPPRHSHRSPSELAEDDLISALHGDFCGMPATVEEAGKTKKDGRARSPRVALVPWAGKPPTRSMR